VSGPRAAIANNPGRLVASRAVREGVGWFTAPPSAAGAQPMRQWLFTSARKGATIVAIALCLVHVALADEPSPRPEAPVAGIKPALQVLIDKSKVDLNEHHLELKASRDLAKVTLRVTGDSGAVLADVEREFSSYPAGKPLVVQWTPSSDEPVVRIEVFAYDMDGYYKGIVVTPWAVSIPHEEVNFRTDSAQIDDSERSKLEASYAKVTEALTKHTELRVTLFIAGHTDTVGDASYNLRLSRQRAQAIAKWFRQRGLKIPIGYEGFGEGGLLVKTADQVDEPRNRRADYILSVDEPVFASSGARPTWYRVP
jgi:outer membrane protein OmpA-like peptidoglycan-associated protein